MKRFEKAANVMKYFLFNEWNFCTDNMADLWNAINDADDGRFYNIKVDKESGLDWRVYFEDYVLGVRKYVLKDDIGNVLTNKLKLNR